MAIIEYSHFTFLYPLQNHHYDSQILQKSRTCSQKQSSCKQSRTYFLIVKMYIKAYELTSLLNVHLNTVFGLRTYQIYTGSKGTKKILYSKHSAFQSSTLKFSRKVSYYKTNIIQRFNIISQSFNHFFSLEVVMVKTKTQF